MYTYLLFAFLDFEACRELNEIVVRAGDDGSDGRRAFSAPRTRMGYIYPHHHCLLLLEPSHSVIVELRATSTLVYTGSVDGLGRIRRSTYQMIDSTKLGVNFECNIREVLVSLVPELRVA